jgi:hypothetical protein
MQFNHYIPVFSSSEPTDTDNELTDTEYDPSENEPIYNNRDSVEKSFIKLKNQINLSHGDLVYFEYQANEIFRHFNWYIHDWIKSNPNYPQILNPLPKFYLKRIISRPKTQVNKPAKVNKVIHPETNVPVPSKPNSNNLTNTNELVNEINVLKKQLEQMKEEVLNFKVTFQDDLNKVKETYKTETPKIVSSNKQSTTLDREMMVIDEILNSIHMEGSVIKTTHSVDIHQKDRVKELLIRLHSKIKHKKISEIVFELMDIIESLFSAYIGFSNIVQNTTDMNPSDKKNKKGVRR